MKKTLTLILAVAILSFTAVASATPGGSDDPFVSKNYIDGTFTDEVKKSIGDLAEEKFSGIYDSTVEKLRDRLGNTGYNFAEDYTELTLSKNKTLNVTTGGSTVLYSGSATALNKSAAVDVTTGTEVSANTSLTKGHRYFTVEKAVARYTATTDCKLYVKGYYCITTGGEIQPPTLREFSENTFTDVKKGNWYYNAVGYGYSNYIINGVSATEFNPLGDVTRGEFITFLYRLSKESASSDKSVFSDVPAGKYYTAAVIWGTEHKIVSGVGDGIFKPNDKVTREQIVTMMYRYAEYMGCSMTNPDSGRINTFSDSKLTSSYAVKAMTWAVENGLINGSNGKLSPKDTAGRAQAAQMIYNLAEYLKQ